MCGTVCKLSLSSQLSARGNQQTHSHTVGFIHIPTPTLYLLQKATSLKDYSCLKTAEVGHAHSDIFLCGHSNDAILATEVSSVIKEKKGVVKSFFLEQLSRKHPQILG